MIIEFQDGEQMEVTAIYGSSQFVNGKTRDVWRIVVPRNYKTKDELIKLFRDNPNKTCRIYTYGEVPGLTGIPYTKKILSGQGYNIFISVQEEEERRVGIPGRLFKEIIEDVYAIYIAQMTYDEYVAAFPKDTIEV